MNWWKKLKRLFTPVPSEITSTVAQELYTAAEILGADKQRILLDSFKKDLKLPVRQICFIVKGQERRERIIEVLQESVYVLPHRAVFNRKDSATQKAVNTFIEENGRDIK